MSESFFAFGKAYIKESLRNKVELFFTVFFPVIFLILFGYIFSNEGGSKRTVAIFTTDQAVVDSLKKVENWNLVVLDSKQQIVEGIKDGKFSFALYVEDNRIEIYYREDPSLIGELKTIESTTKALLEKERNQLKSFLVFDIFEIPKGKEQLSEFDYMLTGVLSLSMLSNGMFSMITVFGRYRKTGVLRRVFLTGVKKSFLVLEVATVRMILSFISLIFTLIIARVLFKSSLNFNWFLLIPSVVFITLGMMAVGLLLVALLKNPNAASNAASLLNTVMVFFAGVYFPITFLPRPLRYVSYFLPVKYAAEVVRFTAGAQEMSFAYFAFINLIFALTGLIMLWISSKLFLRPE
ncbi:ABC transporter permease [Pseudothermotoga thermarum]|uniref:Transport permease protein n=1 Tax=Pseudothermotoga thermarum DSM 5069 TaxID=688269 RepID=F7YVE7_9THEM|nr:ABC transporter permease [Pseudothermotoga thermarum]AEH50450.1 ABC-2 type transporter [Pseudothermotoga thermarum DSM 5069]